MSETQQSSDHSVRMYGMIFTILGAAVLIALIYLALNRSQASDSNNTNQSAGVSNTAPSVDSVTTSVTDGTGNLSSGLTLTEGTTKTIYMYGTATDNNGCSTINYASLWSFRAARTAVTGGVSACSADNNDCYVGVPATNLTLTGCTGAGDLDLNYTANLPIQFYADATDTGSNYVSDNWTSYVKAVDSSDGTTPGLNGTLTGTWEMNSLIALNVDSSISYGSLALGATSSPQTITFHQNGNRSYDWSQIADGAMTCTGTGSSTIPANNVKYSLDTATPWSTWASGGTNVATGTAVDETAFSLGRRTNDVTDLTKDAIFIMKMANVGVSGTCTNTLTFTAIADAAA